MGSIEPLSCKSNKGNGIEIIDGEAVKAGCDTSPVLELAEYALDDISAPASGPVERIGDVAACSPWNDGLDPSFTEPETQPVCVVCLVRNQSALGSHGFQHGLGHGNVGNISRRQCNGGDAATRIGQTMDFRCSAATRDADRLRPLLPFPPAAER